jgi:DNA (cytosine-5)-methyltransferase 1
MNDIIFIDKPLTTIDLFCGIGGIKLSFESTDKFQCVMAIDIDDKCKTTFDKNSKIPMFQCDINTLSKSKYKLPKVDVVCMGFNCQPFSQAGLQLGFDDQRSESFFSSLKLIEKIKPKCIFIENVKNIFSHNKGKSFKLILDEIKKIGYTQIFYKVLNTCKYSILPQNRERIYIVCFLPLINTKKFNLEFEDIKNVNWHLLLEKKVDSKYFYNEDCKIYKVLKDGCIDEKSIYQYRRTYVRENKSGVSPCITANMGTGGHNVPIINIKGKIRKLTPRECFRLQGYPDTFEFPNLADCHLYKQIGNSVSIPIITMIAERISKVLIN